MTMPRRRRPRSLSTATKTTITSAAHFPPSSVVVKFLLFVAVVATTTTTTSPLVSLADAAPLRLHGLNYSVRQGPDWDWDKCKSFERIVEELTLLKKLTGRLRILALTDCGQGEMVLDAIRQIGGLQVWLGMWVDADPANARQERRTLADLLERGLIDDSVVLGVSVGSEAIYREEVETSELIDMKERVGTLLSNYGLSQIPVTIVDIAPTYEYNPQLTEAVDVIMPNSFPFWESIPIEDSTDYLLSEIGPILNQPQAQGKPFVLGETGWPAGGTVTGVGSGSTENHAKYFEMFYCRMDRELGWSYYWFTAIDNAWRQEQDPLNTIEGTWGFFTSELELKPHFRDLVFTCEGSSTEYSFLESVEGGDTVPATPVADPTPEPSTILTLTTSAPVADSPPPLDDGEAQCDSHSRCAGLFGNCCPTDEGDYLLCCDTTTGGGDDDGEGPTSSKPTSSPVKVPTDSPTRRPSTPRTTFSPTRRPTLNPTSRPTPRRKY